MNKEERRIYDRAYHAARSPEVKKRKQELQKIRAARILLFLRNFKAEKGCFDCGIKNPIVLDFDHRDPKEKKFTISDLARVGWSLKFLNEEIKKCDVVCANCHRIRTAKNFGWRI